MMKNYITLAILGALLIASLVVNGYLWATSIHANKHHVKVLELLRQNPSDRTPLTIEDVRVNQDLLDSIRNHMEVNLVDTMSIDDALDIIKRYGE